MAVSDHSIIHLLSVTLACCIYIGTLLITSGLLGHRLGQCRTYVLSFYK